MQNMPSFLRLERTLGASRAKAVSLGLIIATALVISPILAAAHWQQSTPATSTKSNTAAGKQIFERHCAVCHGIDGGGGRGPRLNRPRLLHAPDDAALRSVISEGLAPRMPDAWFLNDEEVADLAAYVRSLGTIPAERLPGDPARGVAIYAKSACASCHILAGEGLGFGPDLTGVAERRSASFIRQTLLNPSSALPENFLLVKIVTPAGQIIQGIRLNEDSFTIQMMDASGRSYSFRKRDLRDLQKLPGKSPMPSFKGLLSDADLDDLVAYLATAREKQ
jgi:cytochrome c oxidase cbb3-type subunit III